LLSAQAIIYLGQPEQGGKSYLFIITSNSETRTAQSLASMVEESCREIAPVFAIVIHAGKFLSGLEKDDLFYNHALHCPVIYLSGEVLLPAAKPFNVCFSNDKAIFKWHRWFNQGRDFLRGSEFYINSNSYSAALFSLHQSAECILTALIRAILHYQTNSHNLIRLLMITEMFTGDLVKIFDNTDAEAKVRFFMLAHAYVNVSYRDTFVPDINAITLLYRDVSQLVSVAEKIYSGI
jgi:HEPN domain-containing protein